MNMTEKRAKLDRLARDVLTLSRNTLLVNLRFLDVALSELAWFPIENDTLLTDGGYILRSYGRKHAQHKCCCA